MESGELTTWTEVQGRTVPDGSPRTFVPGDRATKDIRGFHGKPGSLILANLFFVGLATFDK